jgi:hypothetical protein
LFSTTLKTHTGVVAAGDPKLYSLLTSVHARFGCLPLSHVFLMEAPRADGRYLCAGGSHAMAQIAQLLASHYRPFNPAQRSLVFLSTTFFVISSIFYGSDMMISSDLTQVEQRF